MRRVRQHSSASIQHTHTHHKSDRQGRLAGWRQETACALHQQVSLTLLTGCWVSAADAQMLGPCCRPHAQPVLQTQPSASAANPTLSQCCNGLGFGQCAADPKKLGRPVLQATHLQGCLSQAFMLLHLLSQRTSAEHSTCLVLRPQRHGLDTSSRHT